MRFGFGFSAALACVISLAPAQSYLPRPRVPADNPMSEVKARLGRYLFYDKRMSANGTQSCASCHRQELAFTDGRAVSVGATGQSHTRSAMSLVNVALNEVLTWSNPGMRSLEQQALVPMMSEHPVELGLRGREEDFLKLLRGDPVYCELFPQAFGEAKDAFTIENVAKAIAAFERTIVSARSPYDRYHYGGETDAIPDAAKRGEVVFFTDPVAGCYRCHSGFNFTDGKFHNTALYKRQARQFRTASLRNVALTAPYMHDGSVATLGEAIDHYTAGGRARENPHKDVRLTGFAITAQNKKDLLAFLESLTDREVIRDARFADPW